MAENSSGLKLVERLEYLSRAVIDAAAILSPTAADEQLHREVQEKVEVAGIQQLIQQQTRDNLLDDRLFDLNKLFQVLSIKMNCVFTSFPSLSSEVDQIKQELYGARNKLRITPEFRKIIFRTKNS